MVQGWNRDLGEIYPRKDLGQQFPLREVEESRAARFEVRALLDEIVRDAIGR
jgi:hypothetical protein